MKKYLAVLLMVSAFSMYSCKKDYPEDIPTWLKTKIDDFKKGKKGCICYDSSIDHPKLSISEYTINNETIYSFDQTCGTHGSAVYLYNYRGGSWGECLSHQGGVNNDVGQQYCMDYVRDNFSTSRTIWSGQR